MDNTKQTKIVILGGGFAGVRTALDLEKQNLPNTKIVLISKTSHFEYHAALYRIVTGRNPLEVCIPLAEIFKNKKVEIAEEEIVKIDLKNKILLGKSSSKYSYDYLVLALGSETEYHNVPGLKKLSFGLKSITEAIELKNHLHTLFEDARKKDKEEQVNNLHFVIVGGGATGVETAGELASYTKKLAKNHKIPKELITLELIHSRDRLLPALPEDFSTKIEQRLRGLGVNIFLNRRIVKEDVEKIYLKDMQLKTKTVIWTAGASLNSLYFNTNGLKFKDGKLEVNNRLQTPNYKEVFIVGDAAVIKHPGMAQSAVYDGKYVAKVISSKILKLPYPNYSPNEITYSIPVGRHWAATLYKNKRFYGYPGWALRRLADLRYFLSILPLEKAFRAFKSGMTLTETCPICAPLTKQE